MEGALFEAPPYIVRIGTTDEVPPIPTYEIFNTETNMVENKQPVLANAIRASKVMAVQLKEELSNTVSTWKEEEEHE